MSKSLMIDDVTFNPKKADIVAIMTGYTEQEKEAARKLIDEYNCHKRLSETELQQYRDAYEVVGYYSLVAMSEMLRGIRNPELDMPLTTLKRRIAQLGAIYIEEPRFGRTGRCCRLYDWSHLQKVQQQQQVDFINSKLRQTFLCREQLIKLYRLIKAGLGDCDEALKLIAEIQTLQNAEQVVSVGLTAVVNAATEEEKREVAEFTIAQEANVLQQSVAVIRFLSKASEMERIEWEQQQYALGTPKETIAACLELAEDSDTADEARRKGCLTNRYRFYMSREAFKYFCYKNKIQSVKWQRQNAKNIPVKLGICEVGETYPVFPEKVFDDFIIKMDYKTTKRLHRMLQLPHPRKGLYVKEQFFPISVFGEFINIDFVKLGVVSQVEDTTNEYYGLKGENIDLEIENQTEVYTGV